MINKNNYDIIIIGAGASGLMASIICGKEKLRVLLLEGKDKIGLKLLITGGGRCNITNADVTYKDFSSNYPRTIKNVLSVFPCQKTMEFFSESGVNLVCENNGDVFPESNFAQTVLDALLKNINKENVDIKLKSKVRDISFENGSFFVKRDKDCFNSKVVILCAGGLSYPETGSDGSGFKFAQTFGHSIMSLKPALVPLTTNDNDWKSLAGIVISCALSVDKNKCKGDLLFTHIGFSGPCVLDISRYWSKNKDIFINFLPEQKEEFFRETIIQYTKNNPKQLLKTFLSEFFPARFSEVIIKKSGLICDLILNQLSKEQREKLIRGVFNYKLPVKSVLGYNKAEVTSGGVDLTEVDSKTLESKKVPGLFFAGEMLDVDGPVGGYNLQWAWSSGVAAGVGAVKRMYCKIK